MIFWLFIAAILIQCCYAVFFFARVFHISDAEVVNENEPPLNEVELRPASIIICAKNEADNLRKNLPLVLSQSYAGITLKPNYEVIVVNDASTDDTVHVLLEMEQQYSHLRHISIPRDAERTLKGKKLALSKGVALAAYEYLLLIDADCRPASAHWLSLMIEPLINGKEIVAGYGGYLQGHGVLNAFVRWETMHTWLQYATYAVAGKPYMAVGRNLACTKKMLLQVQRNELWNKLPSGDDDLLVRIAGNAQNIAVITNENAFTYSSAKSTWHEWMRQKQRHLSTGKYYKSGIKALLGAYAMSHAVLWLSFAILVFTGNWQLAIVIMGGRCLLYWQIWARTAVGLREEKLILFFPFFDMAWLIYNFAFLPYITWKNKKQWT